MKVYGIKNCETLKKALNALDDKGLVYEFHDYKKLGVEEDKIKDWIKKTSLESLINKKGTTYKKLSDTDKVGLESEKTAIKIMQSNTSVIKRPILESKNQLIVGFDILKYSELK